MEPERGMTFPPPTQRQAGVIWLAVTGLAIAVLVALVVGLVWGLSHIVQILGPVLWPIAVAGVLAYLLDPVVDYLERRGGWFNRVRAIICVFALALLMVAAIFGSIVPQLINETGQLVSQVPGYVSRVGEKVEDWVKHPPEIVRRILERTNPGAPTQPVSANLQTNVSVFPSTNIAIAPATNAPSPGIPAATIHPAALQRAPPWAAQALPKIGSWLFGQVGRV